MKKDTMSSKERVHATVRGLPVDRVPVMYLFNQHAGTRMIAELYPSRGVKWNIPARLIWRMFRKGGNFLISREKSVVLPFILDAFVSRDYPLELGADLAPVAGGKAVFGDDGYYWENGKFRMNDIFGGVRGLGGIYIEVVQPAVQSIHDLRNLRLPDLTGDEYYGGIKKFRKAHPDISIYADHYGVQDLLFTQIWEMSAAMLALYDYPDDMKDFQRRFADWQIGMIRKSVAAGADIVCLYDDYGFTNKTMISMEMWKEFTYPHLRRIIEAIHECGALAMLHSCGYQVPFLHWYVDAGLDILQGLQPGAGNDFKQVYGEYGKKLCFATGIDTQRGESMTPEELRGEILENYRTGGRNGRHILGATHMLQYTMPGDNIRTIIETVREIQRGMHD